MTKNGLIRVASIPQIKGMLPTRKLSQMSPFFGHIIPTTTPIAKILSMSCSGHQDLHANVSLNPLRPILTIFTKPPASLTHPASTLPQRHHRPSLSLINTGGRTSTFQKALHPTCSECLIHHSSFLFLPKKVITWPSRSRNAPHSKYIRALPKTSINLKKHVSRLRGWSREPTFYEINYN